MQNLQLQLYHNAKVKSIQKNVREAILKKIYCKNTNGIIEYSKISNIHFNLGVYDCLKLYAVE